SLGCRRCTVVTCRLSLLRRAHYGGWMVRRWFYEAHVAGSSLRVGGRCRCCQHLLTRQLFVGFAVTQTVAVLLFYRKLLCQNCICPKGSVEICRFQNFEFASNTPMLP
ncbi:hypothetical protein A2U01_0037790, partial [Trifolium medium]|nr:hypothetical protein [Trifolium medium]